MKKVMVLIVLLLMNSCRNDSDKIQNPIYMDLVVLNDKTDPHLLRPDASILRLFNLSDDNAKSVHFRYREITDRRLVPVTNLSFPGKRSHNNNYAALSKERLIINFYDTVRSVLANNSATDDSSTLDHSECFRTIADELSILSKSNAQNKILLIYSNIFENSDLLSVYDKKTGALSVPEPQKIKDCFEKSKLLPDDLKGITAFFLFKPASREEDQQYMKMVEAYKLLESRGATIKVQADNSFDYE